MEPVGYQDSSSIRRQETFETDPKFAARSKSGGIRKGDLTLPIVGPRYPGKKVLPNKIPKQIDNRSRSPDLDLANGIYSDKTYTKSLLGPISKEEFSKDTKAQYKLNLNKNNYSKVEDTVKETSEKKKPKKLGILKESRQSDTKSVESGDSSKENRLTEKPVSGTSKKGKHVNSVTTDNTTKERKSETLKAANNSKPSENKATTKEPKTVDKKQLVSTGNHSVNDNTNKDEKSETLKAVNSSKSSEHKGATKELKSVDRKPIVSTGNPAVNENIIKVKKFDTLKAINDSKQSDNKTSAKEPKTADRKLSVSTTQSNKSVEKNENVLKKHRERETETLHLKKVPNENSNKDKLQDEKVKKEKLRDKLTSTPVSNYDKDIVIKPKKISAHFSDSNSKVATQEVKHEGHNVAIDKTPRVSNNSKVRKSDVNIDKLDTEPLKEPITKADFDFEETKRSRLKRINNPNAKSQEITSSEKVKREVSKPVKADFENLKERKRSSESLESGFASYRQTDNLKDVKKDEDVISILSFTDTEVSKPPENTELNRPKSNKSSVTFDENSSVSSTIRNGERKDNITQEEGNVKRVKGTRKSEKHLLSVREYSYEDIHTIKLKGKKHMEPATQRKPGSERMTESYESIYEERRTLLEAEVAYRKRIKQLEGEINQFLKTIDDLRSENKALRNRIDSLENSSSSGNAQEKEQLQKTIQSLELQNKAIESKHEKTEARLAKMEHERDKLKTENNDLTSKLTDLETKLSKVQNDLATQNSEKESKGSAEIAKYEKEIKQLQSSVRTEQTERKKLSDENTILKTDKDVLKDEVTALRSINKNLEAMNDELKKSTSSSGDFPNNEKMELKSQIIKLQTDNQTLNEENIKLKSENLKQVKSIHDLEKTAKTFENSVTAVESEKITEIQDLKNENAKLKSDIKDLKENFADADGKIKSLESENKILEETLGQKKSELSELMSALKDDNKFDDEIRNLKSEIARLQKELSDKESVIAESKKHLEEIKIEKDKFDSEKDQLTTKINELLKINEDQKKKMTDMQTKLDLSKAELDSNKEKLQQVKEYEDKISELKTQVQTTEKEKDTLFKEKEEAIRELKLKLDRNDADHKEQLAGIKVEYEKEIDEMKKKVEFLQKEIDELRQLKVVESELLETQDELKTVKEKYSQLITDNESKSDLEQRNFQMNMRMTQMNNTIKQLERDQREWLLKKQQVDDIEASNKRLQEENTHLRQRGSAGKVSKQIDKQIEFLERKQKDAETRVKQLEGWVGDLYDEDKHTATYVGSMNQKKPPKKKAFSRAPPPKTTIRVEAVDRPRSLDDVVIKEKARSERSEKLSHSSTPTLPTIDQETRLTFGLGYSQIHRSRIKAAQKYRK